MFLREAMLRYSDLEDAIASIYEEMAAAAGAEPAFAHRCSTCAARERRRARFLKGLAGLSAAVGDEGPFLVDVAQQIASTRKAVERARETTGELDAAAMLRCVEALEATAHAKLHASLLEVAEGEVRRALRIIEEETRANGGRRERRVRPYRTRAMHSRQ